MYAMCCGRPLKVVDLTGIFLRVHFNILYRIIPDNILINTCSIEYRFEFCVQIVRTRLIADRGRRNINKSAVIVVGISRICIIANLCYKIIARRAAAIT